MMGLLITICTLITFEIIFQEPALCEWYKIYKNVCEYL